MTVPHVFLETNFLSSTFRMPSEQRPDALAMWEQFLAGKIKLYVPYLCFQEARNWISQNLPNRRCDDLQAFHRFSVAQGTAHWQIEEVKKLFDAALGEVSRTKAVYKREIAAFATALRDGVLHATDEVFDRLEALDLDDDNLKTDRKWIIDALILCSILVKSVQLRVAGVSELYFACLDLKAFEPRPTRPKLGRYYAEAGLTFVNGFILPEAPLLRRRLDVPIGQLSMIYLDNAATSFPKPEPVYQALDQFARQSLANPGRAGHKMALAAERALDDTRHLLNVLFHGEAPERFVFTLNCTDALNMAFKGILQEGDHVITTDLEHNSVSRPLRQMELDHRISLTRLRADGGGTINPDDVRRAITPKTRLVALTHASNVLGTVQPVAEIGASVRERRALFLVDAAQTAGVVPIDVQAMHIDLLAFPGHKSLLGPTGTGALYVGPRARSAPGAKGAPVATRPAKRSRASCRTFSKAARPTSSASPDLLPGSSGCRNRGSSAPAATRRPSASGSGSDWTRLAASRCSATAR